MVREFEEEAGVKYRDWEQFVTIGDSKTWSVHMFRRFDATNECYHTCIAQEAEKLEWIHKTFIPEDTVPNLKWLLPLALTPTTICSPDNYIMDSQPDER